MGIKADETHVESFFIQHTLSRFPYHNKEEAKKDNIFDVNVDKMAQHFFCTSFNDTIVNEDNRITTDMLERASFFKILSNYSLVANVKFMWIDELNWQINNCALSDAIYTTIKAAGSQLDKNVTRFQVETIGSPEEDQLKLQIICKSPIYEADLYDDMTVLLNINHSLYMKPSEDTSKVANSVMITQSHIDPSMLGSNFKVLLDFCDPPIIAHIANSSGVFLPSSEPLNSPSIFASSFDIFEEERTTVVEVKGDTNLTAKEQTELEGLVGFKRQASRIQVSTHKDHSKWSVSMSYASYESFQPLLCFYDLNRTVRQAKRGGAALCLNSSFTGITKSSLKLWAFFVSLRPNPSNSIKFKKHSIKEMAKEVMKFDAAEVTAEFPSFAPYFYWQFDAEKAKRTTARSHVIVNFDLPDFSCMAFTQSDLPRIKQYFNFDTKEFVVQMSIGDFVWNMPNLTRYRKSVTVGSSSSSKLPDIPSEEKMKMRHMLRKYNLESLQQTMNAFGLQLSSRNPSESTPAKNIKKFIASHNSVDTPSTGHEILTPTPSKRGRHEIETSAKKSQSETKLSTIVEMDAEDADGEEECVDEAVTKALFSDESDSDSGFEDSVESDDSDDDLESEASAMKRICLKET